MGNSNQGQLLAHTAVKRQSHSLLGPFDITDITHNSQTIRAVLKKRSYFDSNELSFDLARIQERKEILKHHEDSHLLRILWCQHVQNREYCSKQQDLQIFYEAFEEDLQLEYLFKKSSKAHFKEEEVTKILTQALKALQLAEKLGLRICHISKKSILKNSKGNYLLIPELDSTVHHPFYDYLAEFDPNIFNRNSYLSPKLLNSIGKTDCKVQPNHKDNIFSLGVTILSLALMKEIQFESEIISVKLQKGQKIYHFEQAAIVRELDKLKRLITSLTYSNKLKCVLLGMLETVQGERLNALELLELLNIDENNENIHHQKTSKRISKSHIDMKQNIEIIQNRHNCHTGQKIALSIGKKPQQTPKSESKKVINVYLEAKHLFQQAKESKSTIATQAKNYKRSKMDRLKIENHPHKPVISRFISSETMLKDISPIKKLNNFEFAKQAMEHKFDFYGFHHGIKTDTKYEFSSDKTLTKEQISKTSIAVNLRERINVHQFDF